MLTISVLNPNVNPHGKAHRKAHENMRTKQVGDASKMLRFWRSESWALHWKPHWKPPRYFLLENHQRPYEKAVARKIQLSKSTA